jgi:hypothetical protein
MVCLEIDKKWTESEASPNALAINEMKIIQALRGWQGLEINTHPSPRRGCKSHGCSGVAGIFIKIR